MKNSMQFFIFFALTIIYGTLFMSCGSDDPAAVPQPATSSDTLTAEDLDDLSEHLQFFGATKKEGSTPAAPANSSLKFSINDTLHLLEGVLRPVKFLHDKATDVTAVYIQMQGSFIGGSGGTFPTYYYDVPEIQEAADSDSVSIIMVGFEPADFPVPSPLYIKITPIGPSGQPLDEVVVPVVVEEINDPNNSSGRCGLVLPEGDYWDWNISFIPTSHKSPDQFDFWLEPNTIFSGDQIIKGCCVHGFSEYGLPCITLDTAFNKTIERTLPFPTYYQIAAETFTFSNDGTYTRVTQEDSANPNPDESDFCNGDVGFVDIRSSLITYQGNWTVTNIPVPPIHPDLGATADYLTLLTNSSTNPVGGFGNPGGIILSVGCDGLTLIQPDREGGDSHLYKWYDRKTALEDEWHLLHK